MKITFYLWILALIIFFACGTKNKYNGINSAAINDTTGLKPYTLPVPAGSLTELQKTWLSKTYRHQKNGWIYLHIEGNAAERGFQHGYLLSREIKSGISAMKKQWEFQTAMNWSWIIKKSYEILKPRTDPENLEEIEGILEGMQVAGDTVTVEELITLNGNSEIIGYWWPSVKDSVGVHSPDPVRQSCSSFIATGKMTTDGGIVLGHNTHSSYADPVCNLIMDILPDKGHRILMQSVPGIIHSGTDFFITDAGIVGAETTIGGFYPFDPIGIPEFSRMRTATQYASTIEEWCEIMKKGNNGGYANAWLIGDTKTNEIAWLELGLKYIGFEKKNDGYFIGSNVAEDLRILRFETKMTTDNNIKYNEVSRRVRWKKLMKDNTGKIDIQLAEAFEADHYDTYLNQVRPGYRTLCAHYELDQNLEGIAEPYRPFGALDGKAVDSRMAKQMSFIARWGAACGTAFDAKKFLEQHPQYDWQMDILKDRPSEPWTVFKAGEK
jgi:hypothetical protein